MSEADLLRATSAALAAAAAAAAALLLPLALLVLRRFPSRALSSGSTLAFASLVHSARLPFLFVFFLSFFRSFSSSSSSSSSTCQVR